ncbi:MAG: class I SAM-dependent methyltransferase [Candidatus Omnitrophota bacterium]|nr:class I SAM-dependent methyltransferase [Candidatus Omnitrophota bacterium]
MGLSSSGFSAWDDFWRARGAEKAVSWSKKRITGIVSRYLRPGMDILDAGCGAGFFSSYFISRDCNVHSLDYSEKALSIAKNATDNKSRMYINADILKTGALAMLDIKFDIIFTDGLLEHYSIENQDAIIRNMKSVKKEQGYIIDFAPNRISLWNIIRPFVMNIEERPFTMSEFVSLHKRNGLSVVASGGINVLPLRISPERLLGSYFGMLFYCIAA